MPWVKPWTSCGSDPARPRTSSTAAITPRDWSSGVLGTLAVWSTSPSSSAASVKVPPTSTPSNIAPTYRGDARCRQVCAAPDPPGGRAHTYPGNLGCRRLDLADLEGLLEVLVRGAVVPTGPRLALARRALASAGQAAALLTVENHVRRQGIEKLLEPLDVPLDDHVDAYLLGEREVLPNLAEQRLRRAREIAAIGNEPLNRGFTCLENPPPGCEGPLRTSRRINARNEVPIDGTTELIHPDLSYPT